MKLRAHILGLSIASALAFSAMVAAPTPAEAFKISANTGDVMLTALKALPDGGSLVIYSGTQPANPDTALSGNTALATWTLSATSCGANSTSGNFKVCTLSFASPGVTIGASGTASFARLFKSDGTTVVGDLTVGTSGQDLNFASTTFSSGVTATLSGVQLKQPID